MKIISEEEAATWCRRNGVALNDRSLPDRRDFPTKFKIPADAGQRVFLVSQSMEAFRDEPDFLVWFNDWSVWPSHQRMHVFERFRLSYGETRWLIDSPGHLFGQDEIEDAISFVTLAVLFLWDCYVLTPGGKKLLFFSHDEYGLTNGILSDGPASA